MHKRKKTNPAPLHASLTRRQVLAIALAATVVGIALAASHLATRLENGWSDWAVRLAAARLRAPPPVALVVIDDESLRQMNGKVGRFPWPRLMYAPVVQHLSQASAIGFDILFPENDAQCGLDDSPFVSAVAANGRVVMACHLQVHEHDGDSLALLAPHSLPLPGNGLGLTNDVRSALLPHPALLRAAGRVGQVNREYDKDGRMRRYPLWRGAGDRQVPSLALSMLAVHTGRPLEEFAPEREAFPAGLHKPLLAPDGSYTLLPLSRGFRSYAFTDILHSWSEAQAGRVPPIPPGEFANALVLIGTTATGITRDWVPTPLGPETPGLLLHAIALDNLLNGRWMSRVPVGWGWAAALLLSLLFAPLVRDRPLFIGLGALALVTLCLAADLGSVVFFHAHLPFLPVVFALLFCGGGLVVHNWTLERAEVLRLESLETHKQQFTDMLVHDIKGKIGTLELSLSQLEDPGEPLPASAAEMAGIARATSRNLLTQVSALLDVRRLEEGRLELNRSPVEIHHRLLEMVPEFHASASALELTFRLDVDPELRGVTLFTDGEVLGRIVENFLWNALEHARRGSEVVLGSRRLENRLEIFVENEGPSIPPEQQEAVFEPYLTRRAQDRRGKGTHAGLGLAFCKMGSLALGGTVALRSPLPDSGRPGVRASLVLPLGT